MKNVLRLMCGWMAIALAACTGDELQQIAPLQRPVGERVISVDAYTPSDDAHTRLDFTEGTDGSLSLAWTQGDAFTAVIDNKEVTFSYDVNSEQFTATLPEGVALTDGIVAYYPAYIDEYSTDLSEQTGALNSAKTFMEGTYHAASNSFTFAHSTAILKATFSGLPQEAEVASIKIGAAPYTISIPPTDGMNLAEGGIYIYLPNVVKNENVVFSVSTTAGAVYTATQAVKLDEGIKVGTYYVAPIALTPAACNLPTGNDFNTALNSFLQGKDLTQIKFIANSVNTDNSNPIGSSNAYMVANGNVLEIHTAAPKFVFNEDCLSMFYNLSSITAINFGNNIDTSQVTNMSCMFHACSLLTTIEFGDNIDTSNVEDMSCMFMYCYKLTSLNVSNFDTSKVTNMNRVFENCKNLSSLNVSNFNTSKVEYMNFMFFGCSKLSKLDLSNFNTSKVKSMFKMFKNCFKLTSLDLSSFLLSSSPDLSDVFYDLGRYLLNGAKTQIYVISTESAWTEELLTNSNAEYIFPTCNLPTGSDFNTAIVGFLQDKNLTKIEFIANSANLNKTAQIGSSNAYMVANGNVLEIHTSAPRFVFNEDSSSMFYNLSSITAINFGNNIDTSNVTKMYGMFSGCSSLTSLDLSSFNTSNVTTMGDMFYNCNALTTLNVSSFNTSKVTTMDSMFSECYNIAELDLSSFDFGKVADFGNMFDYLAKNNQDPVAVYVYVKNENDKTLLESKSTGINSKYAKIMVKQP